MLRRPPRSSVTSSRAVSSTILRGAACLWILLAVGCADRVVTSDGRDTTDAAAPDAASDTASEATAELPEPPSGLGCGCPTVAPPGCRNRNAFSGCDPPPTCDLVCTDHLALLCNGRIGWRFFSQQCEQDDDCAPVIYRADCCGNARAYAVRRQESLGFERFDASCQTLRPACTCPAAPPVSDDGRSGEPAARCVEGVCRTYVR